MEALSVAEFRGVVQDQLAILLDEARYATPLMRVIARSRCEDELVDRYRDAAIVIVDRDLCRETLRRFESVLDHLIDVQETNDDDQDLLSRVPGECLSRRQDLREVRAEADSKGC